MKTTIITLALIVLLALPVSAQIQSVETVHFQGTDYVVTDVKSHTFTHKYWGKKILILNTIIIDKEGRQVAGFPLTIPAAAIPKETLKRIPDHRPLEQRNPPVGYTVKFGPNIVLTIISLFQ